MPAVKQAAHAKGDFFVDYEEKLFEDIEAEPGEKALVTFHTVAFPHPDGCAPSPRAPLSREGESLRGFRTEWAGWAYALI